MRGNSLSYTVGWRNWGFREDQNIFIFWRKTYGWLFFFWSFITAGIISEYFVFIFVIWICLSKSSSTTESWWFPAGIPVRVTASEEMSLFDVASLEQWQRCQPVSVLALDLADRAVLRVAGRRAGGQKGRTVLQFLSRQTCQFNTYCRGWKFRFCFSKHPSY